MRSRYALTLIAVMGMSCYAARLENTYLPPGNAAGAGGGGLIPGPNRATGAAPHGAPGGRPPGGSAGGFGAIGAGGPGRPGAPAAGFGGSGGGGLGRSAGAGAQAPTIPIVSFNNDNNGDGNYQFSYQTGNGITAQENGRTQGDTESVSGSYSYTGPDGVEYTVTYTADADGFHPQGAHLPTPPPIPPEIQRGIDLSLAAEARGENQDGAYSGNGAGYGGGQQASSARVGAVGGGGRAITSGSGVGGGGGGSSYKGPNSYQASSKGYQY